MDALQKLAWLSENMDLEPAEELWLNPANPLPCQASTKKPALEHPHIVAAKLPGGKQSPMLKTLLTSACERNCNYCPFRAGRDFRRETFQPDEMAQLFTTLYHKGAVNGLFLSSGVAGGGVRTQDRLLDTASLLRRQHYAGFLHLKLVPGIEPEQLKAAMLLADRVSINLEAPNPDRLGTLAPLKTFYAELLQPLVWAERIRREQSPQKTHKQRWPSLVTQFVVGPAGETDLELISTSAYLIQSLHLARVYYSGFKPQPDTPLEDHPPENPQRIVRLYQASFLLRDYGFDLEDLVFGGNGRLPLEVDPKVAWACANLQETPLEINTASPQELLRVPGIGLGRVKAVLAARRIHRLRSREDLRALGIPVERSARFLLLDGQRVARQLSLWESL
jgi:predicted DNA-binding helix-hairpin-helix protein